MKIEKTKSMEILIENKGHFTTYSEPDDPSTLLEEVQKLSDKVNKLGTVSTLDAGLNVGQVPVVEATGKLNPSVIDGKSVLEGINLIINGGGAI